MKHRIEITVKPKPDKHKKRKVSPRPLITKGGSPDVLSRRKTGGYIRFYDLGQVKSGSSWIDNVTQIHRTPDGYGTMGAPDTLGINPLLTTDYNVRDAVYFGIPREQWLSKYRPITQGVLSGKYEINAVFGAFGGFLDDLDQWTANGLKLTQAELNAGLSLGNPSTLIKPYFEPVTLLSGGNVKITATASYAAASVAFTPSPRMDVFLVPQFTDMAGQALVPTFGDKGAFGYLPLTFPRRFGINTNDDWYGGDRSIDPGEGLDAQTTNAIANWKTILTSDRNYYFTDTLGPGGDWSVASFPPVGYTARYVYPTIQTNIEMQAASLTINGALICVVKKGSSFFYFWTDGF